MGTVISKNNKSCYACGSNTTRLHSIYNSEIWIPNHDNENNVLCAGCFQKYVYKHLRQFNSGLKLCECGCGESIPRITKHGYPSHFKYGHNSLGMKRPYAREMMSGENNPGWKGDDVQYRALHWWVRQHLTEPKLCEICNIVPPRDLACVTGTYNRDFKNWKYLCKRCHTKYDGYGFKLGHIDYRKRKKEEQKVRTGLISN
jgi:hypothetical protein